jgi:hypothetical protein
VTGGGDSTTFVLVAPPPQAVSTTATNSNIDKSMLNFLIPSYLLKVEFGTLSQKKYITLTGALFLPILAEMQVLVRSL